MIAFLRGAVLTLEAEHFVLDVRDVGYEVLASNNTLSQLQIGQVAEILIHTVVREDSFHLFGFYTDAERRLFLSLLRVNGIGPKMAITILSGTTIPKIIEYVDNGDVKALTTLPKVGKKTAEQMILTLKGKLVLEDRQAVLKTPIKTEVASALVNLGFKSQDVDRVVGEMAEAADVEQGIRRALQVLTKG